MKKHFLSFIASALAAVLCVNTALIQPQSSPDSLVLTAAAESTGINVQERTVNEIKNYISAHPFSRYADDTYAVEPVITAPYSIGALSDISLQNTLNALNVMRYIAGLDEVTIDSTYCNYAQASALVNCANDSLSHTPAQPSDMSDDIYKIGYTGSSSSNIAYNGGSRPRNAAWSVSDGWMKDEDDYNIDRVGHRRWCLNPKMGKTGFGEVTKPDSTYGTKRYSAMYAFDSSNKNADEYGVCWPAQNTPAEFFAYDDPWSISMGYTVDAAKVKVVLTRKSDGKSWSFSQSAADGAFYVNNQGFGQVGCIIFCPNGVTSYNDGDVYTVTVSGLSSPVSYSVSFFDAGFADKYAEAVDPVTTTSTSQQTQTTTTTADAVTSVTTTTRAATNNGFRLGLDIRYVPVSSENFDFMDIRVDLWKVWANGAVEVVMADKPLSELPDGYYCSISRSVSRMNSTQTVDIEISIDDEDSGGTVSVTDSYTGPYTQSTSTTSAAATTTSTTTTTTTSTTTVTSTTAPAETVPAEHGEQFVGAWGCIEMTDEGDTVTPADDPTIRNAKLYLAEDGSAELVNMAGDRYVAGSITWSSSGDTVTIEIGSGNTISIMEMTLRDGVLMYNEALDIGSYRLKFARLQLGDVNGDGIVDPVDASLILVHNAGQVDDNVSVIDVVGLTLADIDCNGMADPIDSSLILVLSARIIEEPDLTFADILKIAAGQ